jgi:hypothetical protein
VTIIFDPLSSAGEVVMAACSDSILYSWLDRFPDRVEIGAMERVAGELHERSYQRSIGRCRAIKEELMMNRWHPRRIGPLIEAGWDVEDI